MPKFDEASRLRRAGLLIGVSVGALLITSPALAQAPVPPPQPQPDTSNVPEQIPTTEDTVQDESGENVPPQSTTQTDETVIVVTGTRIRQPEFTSPDPVSRIDPVVAQREGKLDTAAMLQSSPIAAGSTQITAAISSNFVTNGGPGAETLNLRGLGANRTLVLLNGRRAGPAGTRGAVSAFDLNVLPQSIVSTVDILKTGASSIYGSDAIAGVVNLITKTEMDGFQIDANASVPLDSGGETYRISGLWGKTFGRGHIMAAVDYFKREELARGDRKYLDCPEAYTFRPDGSRADIVDPRTGEFKCEDLRWGHVWTYDVEYFYGYPGNLALGDGTLLSPITGGVSLLQFQYPGETLGIPPIVSPPGAQTNFIAPPGWVPTGYDLASLAVQNSFHPYVLEQTIVPETERKTFYADASYELTDNIEAFGEFLFNRRETYQNGWRQFWNFGFTGNYYNPYYQFTVSDPAAAGWEGWNWISATGITNQSDTSQRVDYYRGVAGLRGDFGSFLNGWSWDGYVQYSKSDGRYRTQQILQDAVYNLSYFQTSLCADTYGPWGPVTPISGKQCLDLPWYDPFFLRGEMTQEQLDYMFEWEEGRTKYTQLNGEFTMSGTLFEMPAGPLQTALGVTVRRDRIRDVPGHITMTENPFFDPTIDPNDPICNRPTAASRTLPCEEFVSNAWGASSATITAGKTITKEAFGEIQVPIIRDQPFARDLTFSGAARVTNVKSIHALTGQTDSDTGNWTYKLGGNWAVNNWLRFRGTYGTSFRAPALFEQFLGEEKSFVSQRSIDPCIRWAANLALGNISQRVADNCAADGIPPTHTGAGISAEVVGIGGIGELDPETSKAKTASIILTPRFNFLPETIFSLAIDYFDIKVKGEISRLGAATILSGCYSSENFPNDPLCALFTRGQVVTAPFNISTVQDQFINIASQRNEGFDFTANIRHNFGGWMGTLNFLGNVTYQLTDEITLLPGSEPENLNGEAGSPKFVGDFNLSWQPRGGWTIFYGIDVFGKTNDEEDIIEDQGTICPTFNIRGTNCLDVKVPATFYHAASITKEIAEKFELTVGVNNIFDTRPPRVSVVGNNVISMIGPVVATSQYDFYGRRVFVNVSRRF